MTITPDTVGTATPTQTHPVGTHRDASAAPDADARPDSPADQLFAEGIALLDAGDEISASHKLWMAAATAMETYSDARGWQPENRRFYHDIALFRTHEMGLELGDPKAKAKIYYGFDAAETLADNARQRGSLLYEEAVREDAEHVRTLINTFSLAPATHG